MRKSWWVALSVILLLRVFTNLQPVIEAASPFILWMAVVPLFGAVAYMWDGVYIGATATQAMRNMMLLATVVVFLPVYYISVGPLGNHGLWLAMTLFMAARGVSLSMLAGRHIFHRLSISSHTF
jgi:MATE family multidrug resistance protein